MPPARPIAYAVFAVSLAAAAGAVAQTATAHREFGGWVVACSIDGMTDRTRCSLFAFGWPAGAGGAAKATLLWREATPEPGLRVFAPDGTRLDAAFLRVGRAAPAALPICTDDRAVCMAALPDDRRLAADIAAGASTALLRVGGLELGQDWIFDLKGFAEARAEYLRLALAARDPVPARPIDALERKAADADQTRRTIDAGNVYCEKLDVARRGDCRNHVIACRDVERVVAGGMPACVERRFEAQRKDDFFTRIDTACARLPATRRIDCKLARMSCAGQTDAGAETACLAKTGFDDATIEAQAGQRQ